MPVATSAPGLATLPSFASVFGDGSAAPASPSLSSFHSATRSFGSSTSSGSAGDHRRLHSASSTAIRRGSAGPRRDSYSTFASNDSSPTTTVSTLESSLAEPSPASSPESPTSLPSSSSSCASTTSARPPAKPRLLGPTPPNMDGQQPRFSQSYPILPGLERAESPHKKMRNMKNLSVNTAASNTRPATSHLTRLGAGTSSTSTVVTSVPSTHASSAPPTPAFIVPPKPPRRPQPSALGLTLATPESTSAALNSSMPLRRPQMVPPTPSDPGLITLRTVAAPPHAPLFSPLGAPAGGMRLPPLHPPAVNPSSLSKLSQPTSNTSASPITKQTLEHVVEEVDYDVPLSQEVKSPSYPEGPVCIYEPYVFLYLEPSHVEAQLFDVVINVAREVPNPFECKQTVVAGSTRSTGTNTRTMVDQGVQVGGGYATADKGVQVSMDALKSRCAGRAGPDERVNVAFESSSDSAVERTPATGHATIPPTTQPNSQQPEYIHMPWDHNTNVVDDLLTLCQLIDSRVQQKKRVLVHCQCGVSRSASLVVAYGLYKDPQLTVQEAYDAVKDRSRWIGPNMNLIYQLSEFKSKLPKVPRVTTSSSSLSWRNWNDVPMCGSDGGHSAVSTVASGSLIPGTSRSRDMQTHPWPDSDESSSLPHPPASAQLYGDHRGGYVTPGPLSAPAHYQWPAQSSRPDTLEDCVSPVDPPLMWDAEAKQMPLPPRLNTPTMDAVRSANDMKQTQALSSGPFASDLHGAASERSRSHTPVAHSSAVHVATSSPIQQTMPPGSWPEDDPMSPQLQTKPSISDLPIGFSSLLTRRQVPHRLPIRPLAPSQISAAPHQSISSLLNDNVPPTPSLLSPRATEFTASPFHRTSAGDLAGSSVFEQGLMSPRAVAKDPRSPHQKGEAPPITRNILDLLD